MVKYVQVSLMTERVTIYDTHGEMKVKFGTQVSLANSSSYIYTLKTITHL